MAASFGIHIGNTSVCLAVSRDGKTDVVAAPTGDRVTPAIVAFTDAEVVVGLAAKQGRLRNMANTVTDNKKMLVGGGRDEGVGSAVNVIEENGQHFYCVDFKEQETRVSPAEILGHLLTYLHSIAETHCKEVSEAHTVLSVPLDWSREERSLVGNAATKVGFRVVQLISAPAAACLAYGLGQLDPGEREIALVYRFAKTIFKMLFFYRWLLTWLSSNSFAGWVVFPLTSLSFWWPVGATPYWRVSPWMVLVGTSSPRF